MSEHDQEIAEHLKMKIYMCEQLIERDARIAQLEALLRMWHDEAVEDGEHLDVPTCCATRQALDRSTAETKGQHVSLNKACPCKGHPFNCFNHPRNCGCTENRG